MLKKPPRGNECTRTQAMLTSDQEHPQRQNHSLQPWARSYSRAGCARWRLWRHLDRRDAQLRGRLPNGVGIYDVSDRQSHRTHPSNGLLLRMEPPRIAHSLSCVDTGEPFHSENSVRFFEVIRYGRILFHVPDPTSNSISGVAPSRFSTRAGGPPFAPFEGWDFRAHEA